MSAEPLSREARARVHAALGDPARLAIVDALMLGDAGPGELAHELDMPTNLIAHHLKVLQDAGMILRGRSEGDRRRSYLSLVPDTLAALTVPLLRAVPRVVFVCSRNSARSQLAAALWTHRSRVPAASAGTAPAGRVHPRAVRVGHRHGLSLANTTTAQVADVIRHGDLVVAVCDNAHELLPPDPSRLHWSVPDPAAIDTDAAFESAFDEISHRIDRLAPVLTRGSA